jgi:tetratricopeptide (TPR) repeat protein
VWAWLLDEDNRAAVGFVGAGVAAAVAAGWAVYVHVSSKRKGSDPAPAVTADHGGVAAGGHVSATAETGGTAVIQTGSGTVTVNNFPPSTIEEIKKLGVTEAALSSFFRILERREVPPEDLDSTLREIARRYKELEQRLATFSSEDPEVVALKEAARDALEAGDFGRAEALLQDAKEKDIAAAKAMQKSARKRLLSAAESAAELGALKAAELAYEEAATYYMEAVELVPEGEEVVRAGYLNSAGVSWMESGIRTEGPTVQQHLSEAVTAYRAALTVRTRAELPQQWATTQNNLGAALREQGIRTGGEAGAQLLAQAVEAYRAALAVRTRAELPQNWAMTQNNLGNALANQGIRTGGEAGARLLAQAVEAYRAALAVYTRAELPQDWAMTQNNLGNALRNQGIRTGGAAGAQLLGEAVTAYGGALEIYRAAGASHYVELVESNLAEAEQERERLLAEGRE